MRGAALVTGGAGFIGSHVVDALLSQGWTVTVVDNFDDFYDPAIKVRNVRRHLPHPRYTLVGGDIRDETLLRERLTGRYDVIIHLAARAGVRPSIEQPLLYQDVNVRGTHTLLEFARGREIPHFVFASSSSVYGVNANVPWSEDDPVLLPISPYASTKVSGELLGHVYSRLFGIRFVGLRFFTAYGPRQRPDLAIHKFARLMLAGRPIPIFGDGSTRRDYTYVSDVAQVVARAAEYDSSPFEIVNVGNNQTVTLAELVTALEEALGVPARRERLAEQPGDVPQTWASAEKAKRLFGFAPRTPLREGLTAFASWLRRDVEAARDELSLEVSSSWAPRTTPTGLTVTQP